MKLLSIGRGVATAARIAACAAQAARASAKVLTAAPSPGRADAPQLSLFRIDLHLGAGAAASPAAEPEAKP